MDHGHYAHVLQATQRDGAQPVDQGLCLRCADELTDTYSTPCLECQKPWCLDCVREWFHSAMKDLNSMPLRCCRKVVHHGVSEGILPPVEYELYKQKYEEQSTVNRLYCPEPTCFTFIPPRKMDSERDIVDCTNCEAHICKKCKQLVGDTTPSTSSSSITEYICEADVVLDVPNLKGPHKQCPKCGMAVEKIFGCSQMRCTCGANFCWDCLRPIFVCKKDKCYPSDGEEEEEKREEKVKEKEVKAEEVKAEEVKAEEVKAEEVKSEEVKAEEVDVEEMKDEEVKDEKGKEEEVKAEEQGEETRHKEKAKEGEAEKSSDDDIFDDTFDNNHDDSLRQILAEAFAEQQNNSENDDDDTLNRFLGSVLNDGTLSHILNEGQLDLGDEPNGEEAREDSWGCLCDFVKLRGEDVPVGWMQQQELGRGERNMQIDCMRCFAVDVVVAVEQEEHGKAAESSTGAMEKKPAWRCQLCGIIVRERCVREKEREAEVRSSLGWE